MLDSAHAGGLSEFWYNNKSKKHLLNQVNTIELEKLRLLWAGKTQNRNTWHGTAWWKLQSTKTI